MKRLASTGIVVLLLCSGARAELTDDQIADVTEHIAGAWSVQFTAPDGIERTPVILVGRQNRELVAWAVDKAAPEPFKTVRLEGESLVLTLRPKEQSDVTVTLKATLESKDVCVGTGTYRSDNGESGSWPLRGKRLQLSDIGESQKWKLRLMTPDEGPYDVTVITMSRDDRLYAWCTAKDYDLPAASLSEQGGQVEMLLTTKTLDGQPIKLTLHGNVSGDRIEGEVEYDLEGETGSFPFSGQRKS